VKGAVAAGLSVAQVEIDRDGTNIVKALGALSASLSNPCDRLLK